MRDIKFTGNDTKLCTSRALDDDTSALKSHPASKIAPMQSRSSSLSVESKRNTRVNSRILYSEQRIATRVHAAEQRFQFPRQSRFRPRCGKTLPSVVGAPAPCLRVSREHAHPSLIVRVAGSRTGRKFECRRANSTFSRSFCASFLQRQTWRG